MTEILPFIEKRSVLYRFAVLIILVAVSTVIMMVVGLLIALPFFGIDILTHFSEIADLNNPDSISFLKFFQVINQIGVFILPVLVFAYLDSRNIPGYLKMDRRPGGISLIVSLLLIIIAIPAVNWLIEINAGLRLPEFLDRVEQWMRETEDSTTQLTEAFLKVDTIGGLLINLLIIGLLAAIGEELLFRGVVLKLLMEWTKNTHFAIILSSIVFSAFHLQFFGFLPRMFLGIILAYAFVSSGTLWTPVILHFLFNSFTVVAQYLFERGMVSSDQDWISGSYYQPLITGTSFLLTIIVLFFLYRRSIAHH